MTFMIYMLCMKLKIVRFSNVSTVSNISSPAARPNEDPIQNADPRQPFHFVPTYSGSYSDRLKL